MPRLMWDGKEAVVNYDKRIPLHLLDEVPELAILGDPARPTHSLIEGDNLLALKALMPRYRGRVKCVYIDPPYNTGNENWVYNDNVNNPLMRRFAEWIGKQVGKEDLSRHDKWLCFMYPRLVLMRELLAEDGSIWISIDDNEMCSLKQICDEIFGERNYVGTIVWQHSVQGKNDAKSLSLHHNYLLVYGKSNRFAIGLMPRREEHNVNYSNPDGDPRGLWRSGDFRSPNLRENLKYDLPTPSGKRIKAPAKGWRWSPERMQEMIQRGEVLFTENESKIIRKIYLADQDGRVPESLWFGEHFGTTRQASSEIRELIGEASFPTPKPTRLIEAILSVACNGNGIVLDAFAGSATTGHAVMRANAVDGLRRECLLIQTGNDQEGGPNIAREISRLRLLKANSDDPLQLRQGWNYAVLGPRFITPGEPPANIPFARLATIAFFHATGEPMPPQAKESAYLGTSSDGTAVVLLYNGDMEDKDPASENALNRATWAMIERHLGRAKRMTVFCTGIAGVASLVAEHEVRIEQWPQCFERIGE